MKLIPSHPSVCLIVCGPTSETVEPILAWRLMNGRPIALTTSGFQNTIRDSDEGPNEWSLTGLLDANGRVYPMWSREPHEPSFFRNVAEFANWARETEASMQCEELSAFESLASDSEHDSAIINKACLPRRRVRKRIVAR